MRLWNEENWSAIRGFAFHYFAFCQHSFYVLVQFVQLVCQHWVNWTQRGLSPFLKIVCVVESSSRRPHLSFSLFKKLLILPVQFWQCLQLYSPLFFSFNPSHPLTVLLRRNPQFHPTRTNPPLPRLLHKRGTWLLQKDILLCSQYS